MAKEIQEFTTSRMSNGAHFDFMSATAEFAEANEKVSERALAQVGVLRKKVTAEDECLKLSRKNELTDEIAEQDRLRDSYYTGYKAAVKSMVETSDEAKTLWQNIKDYGIDTKAQLNKETGELTNLTADLTGKLAAEVEALGLTQLVAKLKTANDSVHDLMKQRDAENSTKVVGALKSARIETDEAYRNLVKRVNALCLVEYDEAYDTFIDTMNEQIDRYREQVLTKRKTSTDDTGKE